MFEVKYVVMDSRKKKGVVSSFPEGIPVWMLIVFKKPALLRIDDTELVCPAEHFVLYPPMTQVYYQALEEELLVEWVQFLSDDEGLQEPAVVHRRPVKLLNPYDFQAVMRILAYENVAGYYSRESSMNALMRLLVNKMQDACVGETVAAADCRMIRLRSEIYQHPGLHWTVAKMAEKVFLSTSRLHSMYKDTFHVTCMNDVISSRVQYAKSLLECTEKTLTEIAAECGYHGAEHFCRQFKERTGMTPGKYRERSTILFALSE